MFPGKACRGGKVIGKSGRVTLGRRRSTARLLRGGLIGRPLAYALYCTDLWLR